MTPVITLISVDLPAPLSPTRPTISLRPMESEMSCSACTAPKYFSTCSSRTIDGVVAVVAASALAVLFIASASNADAVHGVGFGARQKGAEGGAGAVRIAALDGLENGAVLRHEDRSGRGRRRAAR